MDRIAIFSAGMQGRMAAAVLKKEGNEITCFIDNSPEKQGTFIFGIPVLSLEDFCAEHNAYRIVIACSPIYQREIINQLKGMNIEDFQLFKKEKILCKERLMSYSYPTENEDIILYHVLKNVPSNDIRWIDVGSNDPYLGSVTQLFYERGGNGINIDMEKELIDITNTVRIRDINIFTAVGNSEGYIDFYSQGDYGGLSTTVSRFVDDTACDKQTVKLTTLKKICDEYVNEPLSFLKIDVEGMEKDVLLGMDFNKYRPWIIVIESTLPKTEIPDFDRWEYLVNNADYHFVYSHGVNRYYVANEKDELDERFIPWEEMAAEYCIFHPDILYAI